MNEIFNKYFNVKKCKEALYAILPIKTDDESQSGKYIVYRKFVEISSEKIAKKIKSDKLDFREKISSSRDCNINQDDYQDVKYLWELFNNDFEDLYNCAVKYLIIQVLLSDDFYELMLNYRISVIDELEKLFNKNDKIRKSIIKRILNENWYNKMVDSDNCYMECGHKLVSNALVVIGKKEKKLTKLLVNYILTNKQDYLKFNITNPIHDEKMLKVIDILIMVSNHLFNNSLHECFNDKEQSRIYNSKNNMYIYKLNQQYEKNIFYHLNRIYFIKNSNEPLFFIEKIHEHNEKYTIVLEKIIERNGEDVLYYSYDIYMEIHVDKKQFKNQKIYEGDFVYLNNSEKGVFFINAKNDSRAVNRMLSIFNLNNIIKNNYITNPSNLSSKYSDYEYIQQAYSYHINTGCGNCSIIIVKAKDKIKTLVIDSGSDYNRDWNIKAQDNIRDTINYIKAKFRIDKFRIDDLLITHSHADHINMIVVLFQKYINDTTIWFNSEYVHNSLWFENLLKILKKKIKDKKIKLVNPICSMGNNIINIVYPDKIMINKDDYSNTKSRKYSKPMGNKINNASIVYKVKLMDRTILIPGDLETDGWDAIKDCQEICHNQPYVYCISHHGSANGYVKKKCSEQSKIDLPNISTCIEGTKINILMSRENVYNGIPSADLDSLFENRLYKTIVDKSDEENIFIEVNLNKGLDEHIDMRDFILNKVNDIKFEEVAATINEATVNIMNRKV